MNNKDKLTAKDLVTTAIFSVVFALLMGVLSFIGMVPVIYPFTVGIVLIPCGIVWMYLRAKVPKKGAIIIQSVVIALISLVFGVFWPSLLGVVAGGVIVELVMMSRRRTSFRMNMIGYAIYGVCLAVCANLPPLIARDYFYDYSMAAGMDPVYTEQLMAFLTGPMFAAGLVVAAIGAVIGALLGKHMLKKHFERAGIA